MYTVSAFHRGVRDSNSSSRIDQSVAGCSPKYVDFETGFLAKDQLDVHGQAAFTFEVRE